jgi:hypothetical protein
MAPDDDPLHPVAPPASPVGGDDPVPSPTRRDPFASLLPLIALVGLAVRVAYTVGWRFDAGLKYDAPVYRNRADFLLAGRRFLDPDAWGFHQRAAENAIHPPLNPIVLAGARLLGFDTNAGLQLFGCLVGTITIVIVGLLAREVAGWRVGLIAAGIAAIHPGLWSYDPSLMAETPSQLLTALTLLLAYRFWRTPTAYNAALMAGAASFAALARSELAILLPILVAPLCIAAGGTFRQVSARLGAAVLWSVAVLGPWVGWNLMRFEHPVTLASGIDISLAYAQCDDSWYGVNAGSWNVFCGSDIPRDPANEFADESEVGKQYRARAGAYIQDNLGRWPTVIALRAGRTVGAYRPIAQASNEAGREGRERSVLLACLGATYATYALAVVALRRPPRSRHHLYPLLVPLAAGIAGAMITFGTTRYRAPGEIGLIVLAAVGIDAILRARNARGAPTDDAPHQITGPTPSP